MTDGDRVAITTDACDAVFESFLAFDHVVLAVSGGSDSMTLLVLAAEWQTRHERSPAISVATVDHALRRGSDTEAALVAREAQARGLKHTTLTWTEAKPTTGIPAAARAARYRLLHQHARGLAERVAVATAHTGDDQAETFVMRLARGAGVDGLAAMPRRRPLTEGSDVSLIRPLLDFSKARLLAALAARAIRFVDDPTNVDLRYERPRLRRTLAALNDAQISNAALATSARRAADAKDALRYAEDKFAASINLSFGHDVFASFEREAFDSAPVYLRQKLLERLIRRYGGASAPPELSEIEALAARLAKTPTARQTLGGSVISAGRRVVRVWREVGRLDGADTPLDPGKEFVWDQRFIVRLVPATRHSMIVRPLGAKAYERISDRIDRGRMPSRAAHALPAFWAGSRLVAVPSLAPYGNSSGFPFSHDDIEVRPLADRSRA